jgi:purine-nucleoside phosphorylase
MSAASGNRSGNEAALVDEAVASVNRRIDPGWVDAARGDGPSVTAIVLGSGLGSLADKIESATAVPYDSIPGFARTTAGGHRGQLIVGRFGGAPVVAMAGRLHRYEGWTDRQVAFPIRVMLGLGADRLVVSNAAGGVNPKLRVGDIVVIRDHINWLFQRATDFAAAEPSLGRHGGGIYDPQLAREALAAARQSGFTAVEGTYLATLGPTYETRAEYRMMRRMGADVVGMSTVPEVLAAAERSIPVLALSIVSNVANPDRAIVADHSEVLQAGDAAAGKLERIVRRVVQWVF